MKIAEMLQLLAADGWVLKRTRGSHRQCVHPAKPGKVMVAGRPRETIKPQTPGPILRPAGLGQSGSHGEERGKEAP